MAGVIENYSNKFTDGQMKLNDDPGKDRGRPRTSHTDENCVIVKGLIKEDRTVKVRKMYCKKQLCNTSHPFERNNTV
jgi:hypothetical protein